MLNTDSRLLSSLVWLAIAAICADAAWAFFNWPAPQALLGSFLDSGLAGFIHRNQLALAGLCGFGGLAFSFLFNGWRDRAERRHVLERAERRDGGVLAREAKDIAEVCAAAARRLAVDSAAVGGVARQLKSALVPDAHMLLAATAPDFARLGAGASAAARALRLDVRQLGAALEAVLADGDGKGAGSDTLSRGIAALALRTAATAKDAMPVFDALAKIGPKAADRIPLRALADDSGSGRLLGHEGGTSLSRLLPAA